MSKIYIYSTLSNNQEYALPNGGKVFIAGSANVSNRNLLTPKGVATCVDEATFQLLQENIVFSAHSKNGFISSSHTKENAEDHAEKHMEASDNSAQNTEESIKEVKKSAKVKKG